MGRGASQDGYWCQYCEIYVQRGTAARKRHEDTESHKRNLQRFIQQQQHKRILAQGAEAARVSRVLSLGEGTTPVAQPTIISELTFLSSEAHGPLRSREWFAHRAARSGVSLSDREAADAVPEVVSKDFTSVKAFSENQNEPKSVMNPAGTIGSWRTPRKAIHSEPPRKMAKKSVHSAETISKALKLIKRPQKTVVRGISVFARGEESSVEDCMKNSSRTESSDSFEPTDIITSSSERPAVSSIEVEHAFG